MVYDSDFLYIMVTLEVHILGMLKFKKKKKKFAEESLKKKSVFKSGF